MVLKKWIFLLCLVQLVFGPPNATALAGEEEDAAIGRAMAEVNCITCHAVGFEGESPHAKAPPFWNLSERLSLDELERMFVEGLDVEHKDMPPFLFEKEQARYLTAWIKWITPSIYGKRLVNEYCSDCHAIGFDDESVYAPAPPFRNLSQYYPIERLRETFDNSIDTGHPNMPVFNVQKAELNAILAYLEVLQVPPKQ